MRESLEELEKELFIKTHCFEGCRSGFEALAYLKARNESELVFQPNRKLKDRRKTGEPSENNGSKAGTSLYKALTKWRDDLAGDNDSAGYMVLPRKTILELSRIRPTTLDELLTVKGFGKTKVKMIGEEVLAIIRAFQ